MDFKDYYEILGVAPNAEKKVIQQIFRQLARKHHPDVNPGNKEAEEKFKTYNEAYQVLSDTKQRKKYDELRAQYQEWKKTGGRQQPAREREPNIPMPKIWKICSEAIRRIPTSSPIFLARSLHAEAAKGEAPRPAHVVEGISSTKSIYPWKRLSVAQSAF